MPILSVKEEEEEYVADNGFNGLFEKDFTSDILFNIGMRRGVEMAEYLIRTITGDDGLKIKEVWTQYRIDNIGHSVILDAIAEDERGRFINYEMQKGNEPNLEERRRVYEGSLNIAFLGKGSDYSNLPDQISIFLMNWDIHKRGKAVYHSLWRDDDCFVTDWSMERYDVNLAYEGTDTEEGRMIHDLHCRNPRDMLTGVLRKKMDEIKNTKEGRMEYMSDSARLIAKGEARGLAKGEAKGIAEGKRKSIETILRDKLATPEQISKSFTMPLSEVLEIANNL